MTKEEIDRVFSAALEGDYDDDAPWDAVKELRTNGNHMIFAKASEWCESGEALKRARGADILCQLRAPMTPEQIEAKTSSDAMYVEESFAIVKRMLESEPDERALNSEIFALGHLRCDGSVPLIVPYADHLSGEIRFAAAYSLGSFPQDSEAVAVLIKLADDPYDGVRDWSIFALGTQSDFDSPDLREVFVRHLDDPFPEAREEAIAGLAKRKDIRAVLPLLKLMESGSYFTHHESEFEVLLEEERTGDEKWYVDDFIDALYCRFPDLLPPRVEGPET